MVLILDQFGEFWLKESIDSLAVLETLINKSNIWPLLPDWVKDASRDKTPATVETLSMIDELLKDPIWNDIKDTGGYSYTETTKEWLGHIRENLGFAKSHLYDPDIRKKQEEERRKRPYTPPICPACKKEELHQEKYNNAQIDWVCSCGYRRCAICVL